MCCLFGILDYQKSLSAGRRVKMLHILANTCEERGTDATGISYHDGRRLCIYKRPMAAHTMRFRLPPRANMIMGHTRMTTQGTEKFNQNNHPFRGQAGTEQFALAHNGILYNDRELRQQNKLPKTNIETDSYIAVQLIEKMGELSFTSLSLTAEAVRGSFTFTVMDSQNGVWFVKGNNPLTLYHWKEPGLFIYASTETILKKAVSQMKLPGNFECVSIEMGDILHIDAHGECTYGAFNYDHLLWEKLSWYEQPPKSSTDISDLKTISWMFGFSPEDVETMTAQGMTAEDIEELFYCGVW